MGLIDIVIVMANGPIFVGEITHGDGDVETSGNTKTRKASRPPPNADDK